MFKQRLQGILIGVLITSLFTANIAFAVKGTKTVELVYNNIKIFIDGTEYTARDASGNVVEPFIYNGTTYLPVRGVAAAFGKEVEWDGTTATVYIGKRGQNQPNAYLSDLQYTDFVNPNNRHVFYKINGSVTDYNGQKYGSGLVFQINTMLLGNKIEYDKDDANALIEYPLNSGYSKLTGKVVLPQHINITTVDRKDINESNTSFDVLFYGDDRLIHRVNNITTSMPLDFDISVKGVNKLTIKTIHLQGLYGGYVAITDLALFK